MFKRIGLGLASVAGAFGLASLWRRRSSKKRLAPQDQVPLDERTRDELYERAQELHIEGRGHMRKDELVSAIRKHNH